MAGPVNPDVVLVLDSDENEPKVPNSMAEVRRIKAEEIKKKKIAESLPQYWEVPKSGDPLEYNLVEIFQKDTPVERRYIEEILKIIQNVEKARADGEKMQIPIPISFDFAKHAKYFTFVEISRIQNDRNTKMHDILVSDATRDNEKRAYGMKASKMEGVVFHGTAKKSALQFGKLGPKCVRNLHGAYGQAVYLSGLLQIPLCFAMRAEEMALVMGKSLIGRSQLSVYQQDTPNPGCDTGGTGDDWILAVFSDHAFNPEYILVISAATEQEWNDQVKMFKDASTAVIPQAVVRPKSILKPSKPCSEAASLAQVWPPLFVPPPPAAIPVKAAAQPLMMPKGGVTNTNCMRVGGVWTSVTGGPSSSPLPNQKAGTGGPSSIPLPNQKADTGGPRSSPRPKQVPVTGSGGGAGGSSLQPDDTESDDDPTNSDEDPGNSLQTDPTYKPGDGPSHKKSRL
jgi:hypothetical protein